MSNPNPLQSYDWFISAPSSPRVQAIYDPNWTGNFTSETFTNSNLTVPEGTFLLLICTAFYNITWTMPSNTSGSGVEWWECDYQLDNEDWPSRTCLKFQSVAINDSGGVYSCYQTQQSDPTLITNIQLNVIPAETTADVPTITKQSFDTVLTWSGYQVELVVEYKSGSLCTNEACQAAWIKLPNTVLNTNFALDSHNPPYTNISSTQVGLGRYQYRLIIPRTCYHHSGLYRFQVANRENVTMVDFNVTIQISPRRLIDTKEDGTKFWTRLLYGSVYEISCIKKRPVGRVENVSVDIEFYNMEKRHCHALPTYEQMENNSPEDGYLIEFEQKTSPCQANSIPANITQIRIDGRKFTITPVRSGMVRCTFNWSTSDSNGTITPNGSVSEFRYEIVDRWEFVDYKQDFVIEHYPNESDPLIGDPMTIRCIAPSCQYDRIVLEKASDSNKLEYSVEQDDIVRNDFNGTATLENASFHVVVSLTFDKATRFSSGQYSCLGYDGGVPTGSSVGLPVNLESPRPPMFDITESYSDRVFLEEGKQVQLSCFVDGLPKPNLTWFLDGHQLTHAKVDMKFENTTLTIKKKGEYECQAVNKYGKISRTFNVIDDKDDRKWLITEILVGTGCSIALLAAICFTLWFIRRWRLASLQKLHSLMLKQSQETIPLESFMPVNDQIESLPYDEKYELDKSCFTMSSLLGSGEYGKVYRGVMKTQNGGKDVAVKLPRDSLNADHHKALISELKIMIFVRQHVNVLTVLGACTKNIQGSGFYIITEYCDRGSLRDFLISNRDRKCSICGKETNGIWGIRGSQYTKNIQSQKNHLNDLKLGSKHIYANVKESHQCSYFTPEKLISYAYQSGNGMEYLAAKNIVHRDLAVRNLLLHGEVVKIADFGLSRHHGDAYKSRKFDSPLPIFWMALESILSYKYSEKSDVWSFGVVMWEMFSLGELPYAGKKPDNQFVKWLREGNRLAAPKLAPMETYDLMLSCWNKDPDTRPTFSECKRKLGQHLDTYSPKAYRSLLLTLASAKAAADELPVPSSVNQQDPSYVGTESLDTKSSIHGPHMAYVQVAGASDSNTNTNSDRSIDTSNDNESQAQMENHILHAHIPKEDLKKGTVYLAPCVE